MNSLTSIIVWIIVILLFLLAIAWMFMLYNVTRLQKFYGAMPVRILKHRSWTNLIYRRVMVPAEIEFVQQARRCPAYKYETLDALLIDELNTLGNCDEFIIEAKTLCSLFDTTVEEFLRNQNSEF